MNIYVVDDEPDLRKTLAMVLERHGHVVQTFATAEAFVSVAEHLTPGCALVDLCLPGMSGLELQDVLRQAGSLHRVILLTGFGEVPEAVRAMRHGAIDFLGKPYRRTELFDAVGRAEKSLEAALAAKRSASERAGLNLLSDKEREVLLASSGGKSSKVVAQDLSLSVRTVEMHRSNIIRKLRVHNFAAALLMAAAQPPAAEDPISGPSVA